MVLLFCVKSPLLKYFISFMKVEHVLLLLFPSHKVVSSSWLMQWRKFMQGSRGAQRYLPPGPIDNYSLVSTSHKREQHTVPLQNNVVSRIDGGVKRFILGEDYHVVNFNVWQYWSMIYGGECSHLHVLSWHIYHQNRMCHDKDPFT